MGSNPAGITILHKNLPISYKNEAREIFFFQGVFDRDFANQVWQSANQNLKFLTRNLKAGFRAARKSGRFSATLGGRMAFLWYDFAVCGE